MSDAPLPSSFDTDSDFYNESRWDKFTRKIKEEPLIPLGMGITVWALVSAARSIRSGKDANQTNRYFRYRLYAQSFTIAAMLGGSWYYNADRLKRGEYVKLKKQREAQEKRDAWIRELEAREEEDREWREKLGKVRNAQREEAERRALEEKRRGEREVEAAKEEKRIAGQNNAETLAPDDDGRSLMGMVRRQHNQAKGGEQRMLEIEKRGTMMKRPAAGTEETTAPGLSAEDEQEMKKMPPVQSKTVFGESEEGGLLGHKTLKALWEKWGDNSSSEEDGQAGDESSKSS